MLLRFLISFPSKYIQNIWFKWTSTLLLNVVSVPYSLAIAIIHIWNWSTFFYVHNYPSRKLIVLLYTFWHGQPILGAFLAMFWSWNYPIPVNYVDFHCSYLIKINWPNFVSTWYTRLLIMGFTGPFAILRLSHTLKYCQLSLCLYHKEKLTDFRIDLMHWYFKYVVVVVTSLTYFPCPAPDSQSITWKSLVIIASNFLFCSSLI